MAPALASTWRSAARFPRLDPGLILIGLAISAGWIFAGPVETRPREELRAAKLDAGGHAKPVQIDLIQPLRRDGAFSTGRESCRTMKLNSGDTVRPPRREPIATGFAAERDAQHEANLTERGHRP